MTINKNVGIASNQLVIDYEKMQSINQSFGISDRLSIISINRPTTSPKCLDFKRNTPQLNQLCPR